MKKRFIALVCVIAIISSMFVGCDSDEKKNAITADNDGPFAAYNETLTLSVLKRELAGSAYPQGDNASDNELTRFISEKLNIEFDCSWSVDQSQYSDQVDLNIASNTEMPDIYFVDRRQLYTQAAAGQIWDLTELYEEYASDYLKETLNYANGQGIECGTVLDGLYGIPQTSDVGDGVSLVFIRTDWLDKLNLEVPETLDELIYVAEQFMESNISGNASGTLGIGMAGLGFTYDIFANAYGAYPSLWVEEDGELTYGGISEKCIPAIEKLNSLYNSGVIHKEFASMQASRLAQYVAQGRLGIFIGPFWYNNNYIINSFQADPNAEWTAISGLSENKGEEVASRAWDSAYRWMVVNKDCANPEAAIKVLNLYLEVAHGEYSDWWYGLKDSDEYAQYDLKCWSPIYFAPAAGNCEASVAVVAAMESGDTSKLTPRQKDAYDEISEADPGSAVYKSAYLTWYGEFQLINSMLDTLVYDKYTGPTDTTYAAMMKTLGEYEEETVVNMIMGTIPIDDFDKYVDEWYSQGGEQTTKTVNDWYKEQK